MTTIFPLPTGLGSVHPGDIGDGHMHTLLGWLMGHCPLRKIYHKLTGDDPRNCTSHSWLFVRDENGQLCIGDVKRPTAIWQSMEDFAKDVQSGKITSVRLFRVVGSTQQEREAAAKWWNDYVHNSIYDYWAYPKLIARILLGNWIKGVAGEAWAYFCTEGNADSWNSVKPHLYPEDPTPVDEIVMWKDKKLEEIT